MSGVGVVSGVGAGGGGSVVVPTLQRGRADLAAWSCTPGRRRPTRGWRGRERGRGWARAAIGSERQRARAIHVRDDRPRRSTHPLSGSNGTGSRPRGRAPSPAAATTYTLGGGAPDGALPRATARIASRPPSPSLLSAVLASAAASGGAPATPPLPLPAPLLETFLGGAVAALASGGRLLITRAALEGSGGFRARRP